MGCRLINLIIPGTGLILMRREWAGFLLALVFGLGANAAIAGFYIAPEAIPYSFSSLSVVIAVFAWILAQILLHRQSKYLARTCVDLAALLARSREAMTRGDVEVAGRTISDAINLDGEDIEANVLWARYCVQIGDRDQACRVWQRVCKLDSRRQYRAEALAALEEVEQLAH